MFSPRATLLILTVLIIPILIKKFHSSLELFPAFFLPSGAIKAKIKDGAIHTNQRFVYVQKADSSWERISPGQLLNPIPSQYFIPLTNHHFGLSNESTGKKKLSSRKRAVMAAMAALGLTDGGVLKDEEIAASKKWIGLQLQKQGFLPDHFKIVSELRTIACRSNKIVNSSNARETIVSLH